MKWLVAVLLLLGMLWLWGPKGGEKEKADSLVRSERRTLDANWRSLPEKEMTILEMERFVETLSDDELRAELEKVFDDWLKDNEGRKWYSPPRLAVMLSREIGKRDGEAGMREVADWLEEMNADDEESGHGPLVEEKQFIGTRVLTASFGGWVAEDPEQAISRLIESRENERDDWPVLNQGFLMYFKVGAHFAMERVLRDGFESLAARDLQKAKELLIAGTAVWAFDANEVLESFFRNMPESERLAFFDSKIPREVLENYGPFDGTKEPVGEDGRTLKNTFGSAFGELVNRDLWSGAYAEHLITGAPGAVQAKLDLLSRARPEDAERVLLDPRTSMDIKERLFAFMASGDSSKYELLGELPEDSLVGALSLLMEGERVLSFGPIDGKEDSWKVDFPKLERTVNDLEVGVERKEQLLEGIRLFRELE